MLKPPNPLHVSRFPLFLGVLFLLCFAVLMWGASQRQLRDDEGIAFAGTKSSLAATLDFQAHDVEAPAYFVLSFFWQQLASDSEITTRAFSVLASLITLAVVYRLGKTLFGSRRYGVAGMLGVTLSTYFFIYAIEIRPYALMMLASALSMYCFVRWLRQPTWRRTLFYALSITLMLYTHYLGVSLFVVQGIYFVYFWFRERLDRKPIVQAIGAYVLAFALFLPWFPTFLWQVHHVGTMATAEGTTKIPGLGMAATTLPTIPDNINRYILLLTNQQPIIYGLLFVFGLVLLFRRRSYWLIVGWAIGMPVFVFLVNLIVPIYDPRYVAHVVPGLGLLVGASVVAIPRRWTIIALGCFTAIGLLTVTSGVVPRVPARDFLRSFQAAYQPGDGIDLELSHGPDYVDQYNYAHYAPALMQFISSRDYKSFTAKVLDPASTDLPRCIWFVTNHLLDSQVQAHFKQLEQNRPLLLVIGDQDFPLQRLCAPPNSQPTLVGDALRFWGADVATAATDYVQVNLWWDVLKPPALDYSFGVYVLDNSGAVVAQKDGPISDYWGRGTLQTSTLQPNNYYLDARTIPLSAGLKPGTYAIGLLAYQPWNMVHLSIANHPDLPLLIATYTKT